MLSNHQRNFVKIFSNLARYHHRYEVFRDFIEMASISLENSILKSPEKEDKYLSIAKRYEQHDMNEFPKLLSELVLGLEEQPSDFLGGLFMELDLGSKDFGQFFTPYSLSLLMAKVNVGELTAELARKPFVTLSEPTCGGGGMIIAFYQAMLDEGYNPQTQLHVTCVDLDATAARMCYVQCSLLGIPCEVFIGNTLTMEMRSSMKTPAHYLGFWDVKLKRSYDISEENKSGIILDSVVEPDVISAPAALVAPSVLEGQLGLF